jgi:hypothetical protein
MLAVRDSGRSRSITADPKLIERLVFSCSLHTAPLLSNRISLSFNYHFSRERVSIE